MSQSVPPGGAESGLVLGVSQKTKLRCLVPCLKEQEPVRDQG